MRPRTFILLILVVVVGVALAAVLILRNSGGSSSSDALVDTTTGTGAEGTTAQEPNLPPPTATPSVRFEPVVVARVNIPVGQRLTPELLEVETRPNNNIALQGGYTFANIEDLIGRIVKVEVSEGQAVLSPMIALNATDLASFGRIWRCIWIKVGLPLPFPFLSMEMNRPRRLQFVVRPLRCALAILSM
ncbi:MAG: SAF domain-containing protein [Chloroflexota bacterium]